MAKSTTSIPHDAVFKKIMSYPEMARDFLDIHLPIALREICDLQTLKLESTSFIEQDLRAYYSDVVWSLKTREGQGYIYCVIEHQSTAVPHMAFRLMRYAIAAMQRHLDAGHKTLPLVVPMLFYHGATSPYPFSLNWLDEFADPQLAKTLYGCPFPLIDVTVMPDDDIVQHRRVALLELMQKHIRQRDLMLLLEQLVTLIDEGYTSGSQLVAMQNYMLQRGHTEQADLFYGVLRDRETGGESMMTLAQWFEEKGIEKGIQQGRQEERQEFALRLLSKGMSREDVAEMANLPLAEIDKMIN